MTGIITSEHIISGAIGGAITSIIYPIFNYWVIRYWVSKKIEIKIDARNESNYTVYNLRLINKSIVTLKEVSASVSVDSESSDIIPHNSIKTFATGLIDFSLLSFSKNLNDTVCDSLNINQGQSADINFLRIHSDCIEIASEQGFFDASNKSRVTLKKNRDYLFFIVIHGDNFFPKRLKLLLNSKDQLLVKY